MARISEEDFEQIMENRRKKNGAPEPAKRKRGRGVHKPGVMNKTEAEYAQFLDAEKHLGRVLWWKFEGITLKLAHDCRLTMDFAVMLPDGEIELRDIKGHFEEDAKLKMRMAAEIFPFRFKAIRKRPVKEGGGWVTILDL